MMLIMPSNFTDYSRQTLRHGRRAADLNDMIDADVARRQLVCRFAPVLVLSIVDDVVSEHSCLNLSALNLDEV